MLTAMIFMSASFLEILLRSCDWCQTQHGCVWVQSGPRKSLETTSKLSSCLLNSQPDFWEAELILCFVYFQKLFEHVRNHGIAVEHWPSWISRELSTASTTPINNEDED